MKLSASVKLLAILLAVSSPGNVVAQFVGSPQRVTATLDFSAAQASAGSTVKALVHFSIPEPWHIYWKNPGDAGLPTKITYSLPADYSVDEVEWPDYQTFVQPGNIKAFGYEKDVTLTNQIHVPLTAQAGEVILVKATVRWLACSNICVPGSAVLEKGLLVFAK